MRELKTAQCPDDPRKTGKAKRTPNSEMEGRGRNKWIPGKSKVKARRSGTFKTLGGLQALATQEK